ncbi:MAG: c-type cytochrome [Methylophaga sp.]|nr:c-type cytochrome [Methylophaga sp.]
MTVPTLKPEVATEPSAPTTSDSVATSSEDEALYSVVDGNKLDAESYAGFKLFRNWCARCHAKYGMGLDDGGLGANLLESVKTLSKEEFFATVENGKSGQIGSMPAWKANVKVMENFDQIYSYLNARSDGAIGNVKPKKQN